MEIEGELKRFNLTRHGPELLSQILKRPECNYSKLPNRNDLLTDEVTQQVEFDIKYAGYVERQAVEVEKFRNLEEKQIPQDFDYTSVSSLSTEARIKLSKIKPVTIGQASRISGVSPSDIGVLIVSLKRLPSKAN